MDIKFKKTVMAEIFPNDGGDSYPETYQEGDVETDIESIEEDQSDDENRFLKINRVDGVIVVEKNSFDFV